jgi:hypothetical protein
MLSFHMFHEMFHEADALPSVEGVWREVAAAWTVAAALLAGLGLACLGLTCSGLA